MAELTRQKSEEVEFNGDRILISIKLSFFIVKVQFFRNQYTVPIDALGAT
jgi:hypothetical protein